MAVAGDPPQLAATCVSVRLGVDAETCVYSTRPAFHALQLGVFTLDDGVSVTEAPPTAGAPVIPASVIHAIKAAVQLNSSEPVHDTVWRESQAMQQHLTAANLSALVVPAGIDTHGNRGKKTAGHVRFAAGASDEARWMLAKALDQRHWFGAGTAACVGLGLLLTKDVVVLDCDGLSDEPLLARFEGLLPLFGRAPVELTKNGAHVFFRASARSRSALPVWLAPLTDKLDWLTVRDNGTPSFVAIAPSLNKRPVLGRELGVVELPVISDELVEALLALRPPEPQRVPKRPRPEPAAERAAGEQRDDCFLSLLSVAVAQGLFEAAGLTHLSRIQYDAGTWRARSGGPCCLPGCSKVHTDTWRLSASAGGSLLVRYQDRPEHSSGEQGYSHATPALSAAALAALRDAWCAHGGLGAAGQGVLRAEGDVSWRDFTPWARHNFNPIATATWREQREGDVRHMPAPWRDSRCALPEVTAFLGEHGPEGTARHGWRFTSAHPCPECSAVHEGAYAVRTPNSDFGTAMLYPPCSTVGRRVHAPRGGSLDYMLGFDEELSERLDKVRAAAGWAEAINATIALLDWSHGKQYYERYRERALRVEFAAAAGAAGAGAAYGSDFGLFCSSPTAGKPPFRVALGKRHANRRVAPGEFNFER